MIVYLQETRADDDGGSNAPPKRNFRHWWILVGVNPKQTLIPADCKQARCQLLVTGKCRFDSILYVQYVKDGKHSRLGSFLNKENKKPNRIRVKRLREHFRSVATTSGYDARCGSGLAKHFPQVPNEQVRFFVRRKVAASFMIRLEYDFASGSQHAAGIGHQHVKWLWKTLGMK